MNTAHLEVSDTMTVAAALDADTIFRSAGTKGEPCGCRPWLMPLLHNSSSPSQCMSTAIG